VLRSVENRGAQLGFFDRGEAMSCLMRLPVSPIDLQESSGFRGKRLIAFHIAD
jgi:hypothetical protein